MIIDSSAILALMLREQAAEAIEAAVAGALARSERIAISAATLVEASVVADGPRDPVRSARFDAIIEGLGAEIVPVSAAQSALARQAYRDYGKGPVMRRGSISATASPTRSLASDANLFSTSVTTSLAPTSPPCWADRARAPGGGDVGGAG